MHIRHPVFLSDISYGIVDYTLVVSTFDSSVIPYGGIIGRSSNMIGRPFQMRTVTKNPSISGENCGVGDKLRGSTDERVVSV